MLSKALSEAGEMMPAHHDRGVALLHLRGCQCRFPIREDPSVPGGHRFCAKATSADQVYCALHQSIAITGPKSRTGKTFISRHTARPPSRRS
jgi:hypothetical protein